MTSIDTPATNRKAGGANAARDLTGSSGVVVCTAAAGFISTGEVEGKKGLANDALLTREHPVGIRPVGLQVERSSSAGPDSMWLNVSFVIGHELVCYLAVCVRPTHETLCGRPKADTIGASVYRRTSMNGYGGDDGEVAVPVSMAFSTVFYRRCVD